MTEATQLHYETITPQLRRMLTELMTEPVLAPFSLAGGTSLSLRMGHRISVDIDLFTNADYGSLDFSAIEKMLKSKYPYYYCSDLTGIVGFGRTYYVGETEEESIKLDLFYHDDITEPCDIIDGIRLVTRDDVASMKIDVIQRGGRKKDFWDIHELLNHYSPEEMIALHEKRHPWSHDRKTIIANLADFSLADEMPDPICLRNKAWGIIKLNFVELANGIPQETSI